jgi:hypothetical protein
MRAAVAARNTAHPPYIKRIFLPRRSLIIPTIAIASGVSPCVAITSSADTRLLISPSVCWMITDKQVSVATPIRKRGMDAEVKMYEAQTGETVGARQSGWDSWTIVFARVANVPVGGEAALAFRIENMGPLQNRDICWVLGSTERTLAPLQLSLVMRFSNGDGSTWEQTYELEHRFKCHIDLTFKTVTVVNKRG